MSDVTVILNGYKRKQNLTKQIKLLQRQTVYPQKVLLWYNNPGHQSLINRDALTLTDSAFSNYNFGVWARFAFALNATTKYICIFDDDTLPGKRWLENCLQTIKTHRGLLGTIGLQYQSKRSYFKNVRHGWDNPNQQTRQVDIVGHSWFFQRQFLTRFWRQLPNPFNPLCGQDMHFSYTLQKYMGLNTYVPPHPVQDKQLWGSLNGWQLGTDQHAISLMKDRKPNEDFNIQYKSYIQKGWKLMGLS